MDSQLTHSQQDIKPGDRVIIRRPGKGERRARNWHWIVMSVSNIEEASHQAMKQPSPKKQTEGMMAIQDPAKNRDVSPSFSNTLYSWVVQ